jgi:hypothetical protein
MTLVAVLWSRARSIAEWLTGWIIITKNTNNLLGTIVLAHLNATSKRLQVPGEAYSAEFRHIIPLEKTAMVGVQVLTGSRQIFWRRLRPMWYSSKSIPDSEMNSSLTEYSCQFSFFRGTVKWEKLILEALERVNKAGNEETTRFNVVMHESTRGTSGSEEMQPPPYKRRRNGGGSTADSFGTCIRLLGWRQEDLRMSPPSPPAEQLSLDASLEALMEEAAFWHASRKWYEKCGIPWRRGYVFHGEPGTGKTSFTRALAEKLRIPVHVFDLASMSNYEFRHAWELMANDTPCIALIEDVDAVFHGRTNVASDTSSSSLTFDCLLNCIDGVQKCDGVLLVLTTNHVNTLDDALINRPGRIDKSIEFLPLSSEGRVKLATRILGDENKARIMAQKHDKVSAAVFQEICFQAAIEDRFSK